MTYQGCNLSHRVRVYDHAGVELRKAQREEAFDLLNSGRANPIIQKGRIRGIRIAGPDPALLGPESHKKCNVGQPHRHDNYYNIRGVWHIDRIPVRYSAIFHYRVQAA